MTAAASKRGVILTSKSRPLRPEDLSTFDYIIGMDPKNLDAMRVRLQPRVVLVETEHGHDDTPNWLYRTVEMSAEACIRHMPPKHLLCMPIQASRVNACTHVHLQQVSQIDGCCADGGGALGEPRRNRAR